ncbi:MAG TPA: UvrB/UvrC motif-containing protein [Longimicrobiaceae bacterium]|nr:UvrB/UvrC motif-containing protein [Longimicrobiaceae bacterium]
MRCDHCGKHEAVINLTQIENNEMHTSHLCDACAAEKGFETGAGTGAPAQLTDFLAQMGKSIGAEAVSSLEGCPSCGLALSDFRRTGRLGCAVCYSHFDAQLRGLLRRLHGGTQHVGKVYMPPDPSDADRVARVASLRRSLQRAIDAEDFERAAGLRDQLRRMETAE